MSPQEIHRIQRDLVTRSLLLAPTREERAEERVRRPRAVSPLPVPLGVPRVALLRTYTLPDVHENERPRHV